MSDPKGPINMSGVELEKTDAVHVENESISNASSNMETSNRVNLTAKQQYKQLWAALKADSRYSWWALYCMLLVVSKPAVSSLVHRLTPF